MKENRLYVYMEYNNVHRFSFGISGIHLNTCIHTYIYTQSDK